MGLEHRFYVLVITRFNTLVSNPNDLVVDLDLCSAEEVKVEDVAGKDVVIVQSECLCIVLVLVAGVFVGASNDSLGLRGLIVGEFKLRIEIERSII